MKTKTYATIGSLRVIAKAAELAGDDPTVFMGRDLLGGAAHD